MKGSIMETPSSISTTFVEPTVELSEARMVNEFEGLLNGYSDFRAIAVTRSGWIHYDVQNSQLQSSSGRFEGSFPQNLFSGEQGTGLLRTRPDLFIVYDLAELIEAGISKGDLYDIADLNNLGYGRIVGYSREPRAAASQRSILFADLFVAAIEAGRDDLIMKAVELIRADWS